jgi:hypothetical protein
MDVDLHPGTVIIAPNQIDRQNACRPHRPKAYVPMGSRAAKYGCECRFSQASRHNHSDSSSTGNMPVDRTGRRPMFPPAVARQNMRMDVDFHAML